MGHGLTFADLPSEVSMRCAQSSVQHVHCTQRGVSSTAAPVSWLMAYGLAFNADGVLAQAVDEEQQSKPTNPPGAAASRAEGD
jgi:hypothetical protein